MANQLSTDNGIIRLYDGTIVYIDDTQYSHSGTGDWEQPPFRPDVHPNSITGIGTLPGHKYRRTRLAGETQWQLPEYIVAQDGSNIELRTEGEYIQWKPTTSDTWTNLVLLDSIKGSDGAQGIPGAGLQITGYFAFDNKPTCISTPSNTSGCGGGCGGSSGSLGIYVSIGNHILNATDDTGTYFSTDGIGWTLYNDTNHAGTTIPYWGASDNTGTGALTVRGVNVIQASVSGIDTTGLAYICVDNRWVRYANMAVNDHKVAETFGSTNIGELSNFVHDYPNAVASNKETIGIVDGKLEIIDDSITAEAIYTGTFNDGLDHAGTEINVNASEIVGFGLESYVPDGDTYEDIRVKTSDIVGDGLQESAPFGADNNTKVLVNVNDLIAFNANDNVYPGLITSTQAGLTEPDGFDNLYIHLGNALQTYASGLSVATDNTSIKVYGQLPAVTELGIVETDNGTKGVLAKHVNVDVVDTNKGLEKIGNVPTGKLGVKLNPTDALDVDNVGLKLKTKGVLAAHLSDNPLTGVVDGGEAMKLDPTTNQLQVKYDNTSIGVNGSGELEIKAIDISDIPTIPLTKLEEYQTVRGDIMYYDGTNWARLPRGNDNQVLRSTATSIAWEDDQVIPNLQDTQFSYLQGEPDDNTALSERLDKTVVIEGGEGIVVTGTYPNFLIENNIAEQSVAWGEITGSNVLNQTDLAVYLNKITEKDTTYGNMKIVTTGQTGGLYIRLGSGNTGRRLAADDAGNLFLDTNTVNMT